MRSSTINRICLDAFIRPRNLAPARIFKTKWEPEIANKKLRKGSFKRERLAKFCDFDNIAELDELVTPPFIKIKKYRYKIVYYTDLLPMDADDYGFSHPVYSNI